ncbi:MAG: ABC transporter ATP-binding protein, partial [Oscillospiraceae bacterium]|nr:ABC transporter ATP-binding protein [Oscillospiraceae bacterium]
MANAPTPRGGGPGGRGARGGFQKPKHLRKTLIRMFSYLTRRPVLLAIALFCVVAAALSSVAGTYFMRPIINSITEAAKNGQTDLPGLLPSILQLLGVYAIAAVCSYAQSALMAQLAQRGCNILRTELFARLQELPLSYFDRHPHGELMSRFTNDADNIQMALEQSVVQLISSVISFTATVVMMIYLSPILFLVTVVTLAGLMLVFTKLGGKSRDYYKKQQAALGALNGNIQEMVEGLKVVKAFTHEEAAKETFAALTENYREAASKASFYSTVLMPIANQLSNIGYAVTAAVGGALAIMAGFDIGGLVAYLSYSKQLSQPLNQISMQMTNLLSALAGAERIFEVMDTEPEVDDGVIDLIPAEVDEKGRVAPYTGADRPRHWAWKVPEHNGGKLVQDGEHWL